MVSPKPANRARDTTVKPFSKGVGIKAALAAAALTASGNLAGAETMAELVGSNRPATFSGAYLAGRSADIARDLGAAAAFYGNALVVDPDNPALAERLLLLSMANGEIQQAFALAEGLLTIDPGNPIAGLALAARQLRQGLYDRAVTTLGAIAPAPLASLTAGLLTVWAEFGRGETDRAIETVEALSGPAWYGIFKDYHIALLLDAAGRDQEALAAIDRAYDTDATAMRIVDVYARLQARAGLPDEASRALVAFTGEDPPHPLIEDLMAAIAAGEEIPPLITAARPGAAEALYGLGSAIGVDEGPELPAAYLRLAVYLDPTAHLATAALGDVFQSAERCDEAIELYDTLPADSTLRRNADIQIARCLEFMERPEEAATRIEQVLDADPADVGAAIELGNVYRTDERFAEAAEAYTRGIDAAGDPDAIDWRIYYFRGVSYERSKRWDDAEADFKRALAITPDQPQVLNYLGYSWVDMGLHLTEALDMIKTAVDLRPNDGYIVDSLGWAFYRLDRYDEAVTELERAISLQPEDPTINDHLGDAYWKVGRKREAVFQWAHARDLDPGDELLPLILAKIERGLVEQPDPPPVAEAEPMDELTAVSPTDEGATSSVTVQPGDSLWTIADRVYGRADLYLLIFNANRDRISDPDKIEPGTTLSIPAAATN